MTGRRADLAPAGIATDRAASGVPFWLIVAIAAVVSVNTIVDWHGTPHTLRDSQSGRSTVESLNAYIRDHQRCPVTLAEIGITLRPTDGPPLVYRTWDDRTKCAFTTGDYGLHGFEEYWGYPPGDWYYYHD